MANGPKEDNKGKESSFAGAPIVFLWLLTLILIVGVIQNFSVTEPASTKISFD
ncbi:MAG: hypothetical protein K2X93_22695 [Candidatus Obscuribacterales bacterium]|nr:hypothetical protein [Candidatus Obscuribacterales bacterium]